MGPSTTSATTTGPSTAVIESTMIPQSRPRGVYINTGSILSGLVVRPHSLRYVYDFCLCLWPTAEGPSNYLRCSCFGHLIDLLLGCTSVLNLAAGQGPVLALY